MIVLTGLLWLQVILLTLMGGATIYSAAKDAVHNSGQIATVAGIAFGFFIGVSVWAALTIGGLA